MLIPWVSTWPSNHALLKLFVNVSPGFPCTRMRPRHGSSVRSSQVHLLGAPERILPSQEQPKQHPNNTSAPPSDSGNRGDRGAVYLPPLSFLVDSCRPLLVEARTLRMPLASSTVYRLSCIPSNTSADNFHLHPMRIRLVYPDSRNLGPRVHWSNAFITSGSCSSCNPHLGLFASSTLEETSARPSKLVVHALLGPWDLRTAQYYVELLHTHA